ncbi:MAG: Gx transporter family protein [Atopobiaceae bacterium]|nr:Gx transporter family protein [Atopobiaceae bacterium]
MDAQPHSQLSPTEALCWTRIGVLAALALLLGYVESFVPIPIPGVKLGLANIPILVALANHDLSGAFFVGLIKVLSSSLLFGNPVSFAYAATGTFLAFCCMAPLSLLPTMRLPMVSVVGALAHETGQLLVAQALLGTPLVWYSAPLLAAAACVTGLLCGIAATHIAQRLSYAEQQLGGKGGLRPPDDCPAEPVDSAIAQGKKRRYAPLLFLLAYAVFIVATMHARNASMLLACLALALLACLVTKVGATALYRALAPTLPIAVITLVAQLACNQQGTVLATLGSFALTAEALEETARMLCRLVSISAAGIALVRAVGTEGLASCAHLILKPLNRLGFKTEGPELALATTLDLVGLLAKSVSDEQAKAHSPLSRTFWIDYLPQLTADLYAKSFHST